MKFISGFILAACLAAGSVHAAGNRPPVVLVHGFLGFDNTTLGGSFRYWGGFNDIAQHIKATTGREVFTAGVGPVSSNWDRAIELYYQIKGGCADYGAGHTAQHAAAGHLHKPAGKCWAADPSNNPEKYPLALYPQWDAAHPIHLVGHSQGGQTIRALIQLMEQGTVGSGAARGWITSASTIATPHNGTTLRDIVIGWLPDASTLAGLAVQATGAGGSGGSGFKFRLEQFGMKASTTESIDDFFERTRSHPFWSLGNHDSAQWDLSPDGASELNSWVKTSPDIYYFSFSAQATESLTLFGKQFQYPRPDMIFFLQGMAGEWVVPSFGHPGMGSFQQTAPGRVQTDQRWFANDGVVNTISMDGPDGSTVRALAGQPVKGVWNHVETMQGMDHFDVIGWDAKPSAALKMYDKLMAILAKLD
jgi:triacylglycerol lipase